MYFNESKHEFLGKIVTRMALPGYKGGYATEKEVSETNFLRDNGNRGIYVINIEYL
jgi:hypothetical protein